MVAGWGESERRKESESQEGETRVRRKKNKKTGSNLPNEVGEFRVSNTI